MTNRISSEPALKRKMSSSSPDALVPPASTLASVEGRKAALLAALSSLESSSLADARKEALVQEAIASLSRASEADPVVSSLALVPVGGGAPSSRSASSGLSGAAARHQQQQEHGDWMAPPCGCTAGVRQSNDAERAEDVCGIGHGASLGSARATFIPRRRSSRRVIPTSFSGFHPLSAPGPSTRASNGGVAPGRPHVSTHAQSGSAPVITLSDDEE